jgi:hypothetical protein
MPQSSAALVWLSTAFSPQASTAAIHRPLAERRVADRINTAMNAVKASNGDAARLSSC